MQSNFTSVCRVEENGDAKEVGYSVRKKLSGTDFLRILFFH